MTNKAQLIREANNKLGNPTNKQIKDYIKTNYEQDVMSQEIYSCIGPEKWRTSTTLTPTQLAETKKLIRNTYGGNLKQAEDAITIIRDLSNAKY